MLEQLIEWDKKLLVFLNAFHTPWLDPVMYLITQTEFSIPLYIFLAFLFFKNFRNEAWFILIGVTLTIVLSDQLTSGLMKPFFARLRPSHDPSLAGMLHHVNNYMGGTFGFASSHAANTFGVAMFVWLTLRKIYRWIGWIFLWAVLISYTRIYLGVHFPGDILAGALIGASFGYAGYRLSIYLRKRYRDRLLTQ